MDVENELTLIIGKNNTGKTSILSILDKFLSQAGGHNFSGDDFNIELKKRLREMMDEPQIEEDEFPNKQNTIGIALRIFIEYDENDNLSNIKYVMTDLDPDNRYVVLSFEYSLNYDNYMKMREDYSTLRNGNGSKESTQTDGTSGFYEFLQQNHDRYFQIRKKSIHYDYKTGTTDKKRFIDLTQEGQSIRNIINFKCISAKRTVANKEIDKTLSSQTAKMYKRTASEEPNEAVEEFRARLIKTDGHLSDNYKELFRSPIEKIARFGIIGKESGIEIISTLQHKELLEGNTTVVYKQDDHYLPEHHNGLGYMNLISMIFEIEILVHEFRGKKGEAPSDINLLFIEEPEAHTHPQMQYIFIKNIKELLKEGIPLDNKAHRDLQYIISTHSSCIVADSDFDDIKLLRREGTNNVTAKNLKDLSTDYEANTPQYQFLKQYLTVSRAEIFFADKAILIEGDTERILLPTFMKKLDLENAGRQKTSSSPPLLSQHISIVEVGAYSQIFEKFIDFLGIKALIITDLDSIKKAENSEATGDTSNDDEKTKSTACRVKDGTHSSNSALKHFMGTDELTELSGKCKILEDRKLFIAYQTEEQNKTGEKYCARSFEDAFIHINKEFIKEHKERFKGLQNIADLDDSNKDAYDLADKCIKKKTHFALDILYHSDNTMSNWNIPAYIKEGLLWLQQD